MRYLVVILLLFGISYGFCGQDKEKPEAFVLVEEKPIFPGGEEALRKYLDTSVNHIANEAVKAVEIVWIDYVIDTVGKAVDAKIMSSGKIVEMDKRAIEVINKMPVWKAGKHKGRKVAVRKISCVYILLDEKKATELASIKQRQRRATDFYNDGVKLVNENKPESAIKRFEKCLEINPNDVDALYNAGAVYHKLGQLDMACKSWSAIRSLGKTDGNSLLQEHCGIAIPQDSLATHKPVEKVPEFSGGMSALMRFIQKEIQYPTVPKEADIMGTAYIHFIVDVDGSLNNIGIARSSGNWELDNEALRVVRNMPKWSPGMQDTNPVPVIFNLPIKFVLK
jgi:periplasmic protein TonB